MAKSGHAKNVANFATLICFWTGYWASYDPTNQARGTLSCRLSPVDFLAEHE
ncbi:MAG: hypothetical protein AB7H97_07760 [Pseudobdellovibrionaceae bacterium]